MLSCTGPHPDTLPSLCNHFAPPLLLVLCSASQITPRILLLIRRPFMVRTNKTSMGKQPQENMVVLWLY